MLGIDRFSYSLLAEDFTSALSLVLSKNLCSYTMKKRSTLN